MKPSQLASRAAVRSPARQSGRRANRASSARSILSFRVCVAEAESMATAFSRSPLYVRGGHLHALEKLFVAHSIHRQDIDKKIYMT